MRNVIASATGALCAATAAFAAFSTSEPSYLLPTATGDFNYTPLVTVGDYVPLTGGAPTEKFAFVGIPDAMGLYKDPVSGENILFVAHELPSGTATQPFFGGPSYLGAWVSRFVLDGSGYVTSGGFAHKELYLANTFFNPTPIKSGDGKGNGFTRFCSGSFAGPAHGMDRPIFLTNEESSGGTFDAAGSQTVAIYDGAMHTVPALGRVARETTLVMPRRDSITAIVSTEDGGTQANPYSYVYLYVGNKDRRASDALTKNGLTAGKIYVLGLAASGNEGTFMTGSAASRWIEIPNAASLTAAQLNAAALAAGAFGFVRVEDAEFDPTAPTRTLFLATTGGSSPNRLGRLYKLTFNPITPAAAGALEVVYNADAIVTPGGDINAGVDFAVSIDNIAVTANYIVICEDRNSPADAVFAKYGRTGGVWTLDRKNNYAAKFQGSFNYAYTNARDGVTRTAGLWESSGVVDASAIYGPDTFIINVQAHSNSTNARSNIANPAGGVYTKAQATSLFAEDGQLLLMHPKSGS